MIEYVAARFKNIITNNLVEIARRMKSGEMPTELLSRQRMNIMAAFDLGPRWQALANGMTLFIEDENGKITCPIADAINHPDITIKTEKAQP